VAQIILMAREMEWAEGELRSFIGTLTTEERYHLVALMWVGRGSFDASEWD